MKNATKAYTAPQGAIAIAVGRVMNPNSSMNSYNILDNNPIPFLTSVSCSAAASMIPPFGGEHGRWG